MAERTGLLSVIAPLPLLKEHFMNKLAVLALTTVSLLLAACNTVKGAGKDIESVGSEGEKVINE